MCHHWPYPMPVANLLFMVIFMAETRNGIRSCLTTICRKPQSIHWSWHIKSLCPSWVRYYPRRPLLKHAGYVKRETLTHQWPAVTWQKEEYQGSTDTNQLCFKGSGRKSQRGGEGTVQCIDLRSYSYPTQMLPMGSHMLVKFNLHFHQIACTNYKCWKICQ